MVWPRARICPAYTLQNSNQFLPLENMPYPQWMKRLIRFSQRGKLYLGFCIVIGIVAFPLALVVFLVLTLWQLLVGRFRR